MSNNNAGKRTYAAAAAGVPALPPPSVKRGDRPTAAIDRLLARGDPLTNANADDDDVKSVGSQHFSRPEDDPTAWTAELATADKLAREMLAFAMPHDSGHSLSTMRAGNDLSSGTAVGPQSKSSHWPHAPPQPSPDAGKLLFPRVTVGGIFSECMPPRAYGDTSVGTPLPPALQSAGSAEQTNAPSADGSNVSAFAVLSAPSTSSSTASKDSQRRPSQALAASKSAAAPLRAPHGGVLPAPASVVSGPLIIGSGAVPSRVVVGVPPLPTTATHAPPQVTVGVAAAATAARLRDELQQQHSAATPQEQASVEAPLKIRNVYVAALPMDFTDADLSELLSQFGKLKSCRMFNDTGRVAEIGRAYGFALFEDAAAAEAAVAALDGKPFRSARLQCQLSRNGVVKKPKDRRRGATRGEASGDASALLSRSSLEALRRPDDVDDPGSAPSTPPPSTTPPRTPRANRYVKAGHDAPPRSPQSAPKSPPPASLPAQQPPQPQQQPQQQPQPWPYMQVPPSGGYPGFSSGYPPMMMMSQGAPAGFSPAPPGVASYPPFGYATYPNYGVPPTAGFPMAAAVGGYPMSMYGGYGGAFPMVPPPGPPGSQVTTVVYHYHYPSAPS